MNEVTVKLNFTDDELFKIEELKNKLGLANNAEVIAYAVSLLFRIQESRRKGDKVEFPPDRFYPSGSTTTVEF